MGYYRGEYEHYYRELRQESVGGGNYLRSGNINSTVNRKYVKRRSKANGLLQMIMIQTTGIIAIMGCIYVGGFSKNSELKKTSDKIKTIITTDYYFNEKEIIMEFKNKILEKVR